MDDPNGGPLFGPIYDGLADHMPTRLVAGTETLTLEGVEMQLIHTGMAHTSADLMVYLPAQRVVYAGDILVYEGPYPVIHAGGSSLGLIEAAEAMLTLDADTFVPGHGEMKPRAEIEQFLADAKERRAAVKEMFEEGATLEEVTEALPDQRADPRFPTFTEVVYTELSEGYPPAEAPWVQLQQ